MSSRPQSLLTNLGLLALTLLCTIIAGETGLRAFGIEKGHVEPPPIYRKSMNPEISYELKPDMSVKAFRSEIKTDSRGFRSPEPDASKPVIAFLGDSMTFGYGVQGDETIPARVGQRLTGYSVVNAAVPGYNLLQETATYREKVAPLSPKALVLVFYWNDLQDMEPAVLADDGNLYPKDYVPPTEKCAPVTDGLLGIIPGKCWLDTHSAIYRVIKKMVIARTGAANKKQQEQNERADPFGEYLKPENVSLYEKQLPELVALLPKDLPRLFVIWPEAPLHFQLRDRLTHFAETQGFKVLDLYDVFGNAPQTLDWDTVHPSARTIQQASDVIVGALRHHKLISL